MSCRVMAIWMKISETNGMGTPQSITRPFGSCMDIKGNPAPKLKKGKAWGPQALYTLNSSIQAVQTRQGL